MILKVILYLCFMIITSGGIYYYICKKDEHSDDIDELYIAFALLLGLIFPITIILVLTKSLVSMAASMFAFIDGFTSSLKERKIHGKGKK